MLNDDTHAQHICNSKIVVLFRFAPVSAKMLDCPKTSIFSRCNDTCKSFSNCYIIKQLLTNEALDMM